MPILNYTTKISAGATVGEIQAKLAAHGANGVSIDYDSGMPEALAFRIQTPHGLVTFRMEANWRGVLAAMEADQNVPRAQVRPDQAQRVAWRILKDWVEAQLAIVEAGLATLTKVMLPYAVTATGQTVYQRLETEGPELLQLG
nr:hypothetical protein [Gemmatimonadaceae bacterium]